ncbi:MAG: glycoside hydrolase family 2 [Tannerella sp.]|nr:glycoside hydrolase family 2 [Tannerella sp.]
MKRQILIPLIGLVGCIVTWSCTESRTKENEVFRALEEGFRTIPDSTRIGCYWYWISDNISKEAVVRDLEAMKAAGITRAFIGNIGLDDVPYGHIGILTPEWWEVMHAALKKASELDIEIGIFNSPGWSQSGGPWVKPQESMRYLASADVTVKKTGAGPIRVKLPDMGKDAQEVRVIAYPAPGDCIQKTWNIQKKDGQALTVDLTLPQPAAIRTFTYITQTPVKTDAELFVKEGDKYRSLKKIHIDRSNASLNVGFIPYAPIVISLPETQAASFRLVMSESGGGDADVTLSSQPKVERYAEKTLAKMFQTPLPMWHDYLWEAQPEVPAALCTAPERVMDLTAKVSDGVLEWDAPEGDWIISRTAMRPTGVTNSPASPEGTGLEIDKLSRQHVASHFDAFIGEILRRIPAEDRTCFKVVVEDSYETGGQNWTDGMIEHFKTVYGYDPVPYLPVLNGVVVGSPDHSDRFLWDLRRLVADRVSYEYVGGLREISNRHGLTTWLENYGHWGFPGEFLQYGGQSDEIGGEFWSEGSLGDIENRAASSCGHIYGKRKVWAESCTSGGPVFKRYPGIMKQRVDRFFTEGINSTLLHVCIQQPFEDREPGLAAAFGNEFNRKNTWFGQIDMFTDYLRRCNFLLQQGLYVADVACFIGEDTPKMTGVCTPEVPKGYSFDYMNAEVLLTRASVKDGKLTLSDGMQYSLLVLPPLSTMRPEVLRKISELVHDGLVILGPAPKQSPSLARYPQADAEVAALAGELWGAGNEKVRTVGKGRVFADGQSISDVFAVLQIAPDFSPANDPESPVLFIHRTLPEGDIYFVSNQSDRTVTFHPEFRVAGKAPEWWNPATGEIRRLPAFHSTQVTTALPLELQPFESGFVIFRAKGSPAEKENFPEKEVLLTLATPWQVTFEPGKRGPEEPVIFSTLEDWSTSSDTAVRYFSGTAVYRTGFTLETLPEKTCYIDLGKVMVMAKVRLNGQPAGGVWTMPYRVNVTGILQEGENLLEVEVVNNWMNRLIGDQRLPEKERKTWVNVNPWKADSPLQLSGLLGPVEIQAFSY